MKLRRQAPQQFLDLVPGAARRVVLIGGLRERQSCPKSDQDRRNEGALAFVFHGHFLPLIGWVASMADAS